MTRMRSVSVRRHLFDWIGVESISWSAPTSEGRIVCLVVVDSCKGTVTQAGKLKGDTHHHDFIDLFYIQNVIASAVARVLFHAFHRWVWYCSASGPRSYLGAPPIQAGVSYDVERRRRG